MANFFYAKAVYADGHTETFDGRLWFLGGIPDTDGQALLAKLKAEHDAGIIT